MTVRGINFPFQRGDTGFPESAEDEDMVRALINVLLETGVRERVMRPEEGMDAWLWVMENNNDILQSRIRRSVLDAIGRSRIPVSNVNVIVEAQEENTVLITVEYEWNGQEGEVTVEVPRGV